MSTLVTVGQETDFSLGYFFILTPNTDPPVFSFNKKDHYLVFRIKH
jgi:hypothetical protein